MEKKVEGKKMASTVGFVLTTVVLVFLIVFFAGMTVKGQTRISEQEVERCYRDVESELKKEVRKYLTEAGYRNSGFALTRVVEEGNRYYTLTIHHSKIDILEEGGKEALREELLAKGIKEGREAMEDIVQSCGEQETQCSFCVEFL